MERIGCHIAEKLYQNDAFWSEDRIAQAAALGLTPAEASTLASIVMKESSKSDDRPRVARLYGNRLGDEAGGSYGDLRYQAHEFRQKCVRLKRTEH